MNKEKIIKKSETFSKIINLKQVVRGKYFNIYYEQSNKNQYGITVPKKIGKANIRNRIKRQIKNIIITNEFAIQKNFNYVIIIKEAILELNYQNIKIELINQIKKVGN